MRYAIIDHFGVTICILITVISFVQVLWCCLRETNCVYVEVGNIKT